MEADDGPLVLIVIGILSVFFGFLVGGWFWGNLMYVGVSWFIAGVVLKLSERELTGGAFLAGFIVGVVGAVLWIVIDMSRSDMGYKRRSIQRSYQSINKEDFRCGNCFWIGKSGCPRNETLINAEPCADFKLWRRT